MKAKDYKLYINSIKCAVALSIGNTFCLFFFFCLISWETPFAYLFIYFWIYQRLLIYFISDKYFFNLFNYFLNIRSQKY